jgi:septum formation protein
VRLLILASLSPRRKEILERAGFQFHIRTTPVLEERADGESPDEYVRRLARDKAEAVPLSDGEIILGADTTVVVGDQILEKPRDAADAARMLRELSGREHRVLTGICLRDIGTTVIDHAETAVRFISLTESEIAEYVDSGEPMDKAGAYAIQGMASKFIESIDGCYWNVVGLPIALVYARLKEEFGFATVHSEDCG